MIAPSFSVPDDDVAIVVHSILHSFFDSYYTHASLFFNHIFEFTSQSLNGPPPLLVIALNEISEICKVEYRHLSNKATVYCPQLFETLKDRIDEIMCDIDPDDLEIRDTDLQAPYEAAAMTLASFYKVTPPAVFQFVVSHFDRNIKSDVWTVQHAAIMSVCAIVGGPPNSMVVSFLHDCAIPNLAVTATQNDNIRIKERSLFALSYIISKIPTVLGNTTNVVAISQYVQHLMTVFSAAPQTPPPILVREAQLLTTMFEAFYKHPLLGPFGVNFEPIDALIQQMMDHPVAKLVDTMVFRSACNARSAFVGAISVINRRDRRKAGQKDPVHIIMTNTCNRISAACQMVEGEDVRYEMTACLLDTLVKCMGKYCAPLGDLAQPLFNLIMSVLKNRAMNIYEESLNALALFANAMENHLELDMINPMCQALETAYTCPSPMVITSANNLLTQLFLTQTSMEQFADMYFFKIVQLLQNLNTTPFHPSIPSTINTLAVIFDTLPKTNERAPLFVEIITSFVNITIDPDSNQQLEFGDNISEAMSRALKCYINLNTVDDKIELPVINLVHEFILRVPNKLTHPSKLAMTAICSLLNCLSDRTRRDDNCKLNKRFVHNLLLKWVKQIESKSDKDMTLRKTVKDAYDLMMSV